MKIRSNIRGKAAREDQGATLALVIACAIVVVIVGIAFIFISMLFGGGREVQNAVDSASLNVSKYGAYGIPSGSGGAGIAISTPTSATADQVVFLQEYLQQPPSGSVGNMGPTDSSGCAPVDLATFNRLVAAALVVQMNASADGTAAGLAHAQSLFNAVEGSNNSYGSLLSKALQSSTWAAVNYNGISNAARMIGLTQGTPTFNPTANPKDWACGWIYQQTNMPANVDLSAYNASKDPNANQILPITDYSANPPARLSLPAGMFSTYSATGQAQAASPGSQSYLSGYTPIQIGGKGPSYFGVPNGPTKQPHLESFVTFRSKQSNGTDPSTSPSGGIPPNAFMVGGQTAVSQTRSSKLDITSISTVGVQNAIFKPGLVNGYLVIDNGGPSTFNGTNPNLNTVAANQLMSGVTVDPSGYFSMASDPKTGQNLVSLWETTPSSQRTDSYPPITDGSGGNIYNASGQPATRQQISNAIQFVGSGNPPSSILCTDTNSSPPDGLSTCLNEFSPSPPAPNGLPCAGDVAYNGYPAGVPVPSSPVSADSLTATEMTQMEAGTLFGDGHSPTGTIVSPTCFNFPSGAPNNVTGLRLFQEGLPSYSNQYPCYGNFGGGLNKDDVVADNMGGYHGPFTANMSSSNNPGQVTISAGVYDYIKQYFEWKQPGVTVKTIRFMVQRLCQIKPDLAKGLTISVAGNRVTTNSDEINRVLSLGQYSYIDNGGQASPPFPIVLGKNSFIYLNPKTNKLTLDTSGPAHVSKLSALAAVPDGQQLAKIKVDSGQSWDSNYNIFMGVTNAYGSHNIHDQMFRTWGSDSSGSNYQGGSVATDTLTVSASSGATGGMLGMVKFEEYTSGGMNVALGGGTNLTNRN